MAVLRTNEIKSQTALLTSYYRYYTGKDQSNRGATLHEQVYGDRLSSLSQSLHKGFQLHLTWDNETRFETIKDMLESYSFAEQHTDMSVADQVLKSISDSLSAGQPALSITDIPYVRNNAPIHSPLLPLVVNRLKLEDRIGIEDYFRLRRIDPRIEVCFEAAYQQPDARVDPNIETKGETSGSSHVLHAQDSQQGSIVPNKAEQAMDLEAIKDREEPMTEARKIGSPRITLLSKVQPPKPGKKHEVMPTSEDRTNLARKAAPAPGRYKQLYNEYNDTSVYAEKDEPEVAEPAPKRQKLTDVAPYLQTWPV